MWSSAFDLETYCLGVDFVHAGHLFLSSTFWKNRVVTEV